MELQYIHDNIINTIKICGCLIENVRILWSAKMHAQILFLMQELNVHVEVEICSQTIVECVCVYLRLLEELTMCPLQVLNVKRFAISCLQKSC